jgi:hypothetical protein
LQALLNKGEDEVLAAIPRVRRVLPIELLGFDSDNGGEFINHKVANYCRAENITFTRSREYKKNDQAFVEEKNGSVVRRLTGYERLEGESACGILNSLYKAARLYVNYFQPSLKLASKIRLAGRVKKQYLSAKTPCQRLLESDISEPQKKKLRMMFSTLDPVALLGRIELIQAELASGMNTQQAPERTDEPVPLPPAHTVPEACLTGTRPNTTKAKRPDKRKSPGTHKKRGRKNLVSDKMLQAIHEMLKENPTMTPAQLMTLLNKQHPGSFSIKQKPTLARVINRWLEAHPEF